MGAEPACGDYRSELMNLPPACGRGPGQPGNGSLAVSSGAAIAIVAPDCVARSVTRAEPGAKSASADSAKIEKAEVTASCLDIVVTDLRMRI